MRQVNGSYVIRFQGIAGRVYRVDGSASLAGWSDLGAATHLGNGSHEFVDTTGGFQQRFYRIREP